MPDRSCGLRTWPIRSPAALTLEPVPPASVLADRPGLFKKVVVSQLPGLGTCRSRLRGTRRLLPGREYCSPIYGYAIQIYADFSGYTDIAIGLRLAARLPVPEELRRSVSGRVGSRLLASLAHDACRPGCATTLYVPLGGNRGGRLMTCATLRSPWLLGGLWHGAAWTFVVWGAIHAVALSVERLASAYWQPLGFRPALVSTMRWLTTFHVICLSWVFFRAESFGQAFALLGRLTAGGESIPLVSAGLLLIVGLILAAQFVPPAAPEILRSRFGLSGPGFQIIALVLVLTAIDAFGPDGVAPFIYFQF